MNANLQQQLHDFLSVSAILIILAAVFAAGYCFGVQAPDKPPPPATFGKQLTELHSYMRDPTIRWAWRQSYCKRDSAGNNATTF